jgi:tRNA pseudouridine38-40 synthase
MKRYLITFSYDGTNYNGYQKQPKLRTVQGELENALKFINNNKDVILQASGRTDAHVHALNQKAHFDLDAKITTNKLRLALNSNTDDDIYVKSVIEVDNNFHARYNVKYKEYIYKINMGDYNPIERNIIYQYNKKLDIKTMKKAIKYFKGEHDFTAFACQDELKDNCVRTIIKANISRTKDILIITFKGNGFLKYQVRNMIGALISIGENKKKPKDIIAILNSKNRILASKTANPEGLYLNNVWY